MSNHTTSLEDILSALRVLKSVSAENDYLECLRPAIATINDRSSWMLERELKAFRPIRQARVVPLFRTPTLDA
jgi:hypothetical protein